MLEVKLSGKMNATFRVKNPNKIAMWKMLEAQNREWATFVFIHTREL